MATILRSALDLGTLVRASRLAQGLSQAELARGARVGRQWLVGLEAGGKVSAPFDMVMRVLRELRLAVTLDPAHSLVTSPRPAPKAIYWKPEA